VVTTFRTDTSEGIYTVLAAYALAHPDQLVRAYRARPGNIAQDLPCAFVDAFPEAVSHDSGTRTRIAQPSVVVVRAYTDNAEVAAAFDALVDGLLDAFTAVPSFMPGTIWDKVTIDDFEEAAGDYLFPAVRFTFGNISIMEGRD
jgi:hypothetical protein